MKNLKDESREKFSENGRGNMKTENRKLMTLALNRNLVLLRWGDVECERGDELQTKL